MTGALLYIGDVEASVARPLKELKGFERIHLDPGEEKEVSFALDLRSLAFYDVISKKWTAEEGEFIAYVGPDSERGLETHLNY